MAPTQIARLLLLSFALTLSGGVSEALAQQRGPREFQAPREISEEEIRAAKEKSKSNLSGYDKDVTNEVTPVPWMAIGLMVFVFAVATPFALRYYRDTAAELRDRNAPPRTGTPRKRTPADPDEA